jgi:4-amino-4-deoxy-L-arabinose transferase-like glycosyltransferase
VKLTVKRFTLALFVLALLPRVFVAVWLDGEPAWDGGYYHIGAVSIAKGLGYAGETGAPWSHYPVGYSALIGGVYSLFGARPIVATLSNAVVGAWLACGAYLLARHATSEGRARIAGLLTAFYPGLVIYTALIMTEPVAALAIVGAALVAAHTRASVRGSLLAGFILGLGTLVRPQSLLLAPFIGLFQRRKAGGELKPMLLASAIATVTTLAVVSPWTIRNCRVMDDCAFVSTNAGWNLAIGSFPRATGRFETLRAGDGCHIVTGQAQQDRCWVQHGMDWIVADPRRWVWMMPTKLGFTFDHESFPIGYLSQMNEVWWTPARQAMGRGILSWSHRALLAGAAFGLLGRATRRRPPSLLAPLGLGLLVWFAAASLDHPFWLVALALMAIAAERWRKLSATAVFAAVAVATVALTHAVFFGEDRYHLVLTPLLCLLATCVGQRDGQPAAAEVDQGA